MGVEELRSQGVRVRIGLMEQKARRLNECFFKHNATKLPFVTLKIAMSLDGKIATPTGESRWITTSESRSMVHSLRDRSDAIMVGVGTALTDNPSLTARLPNGQGKDPLRVIVDSKARIPVDAKVIAQTSTAVTIIAVTPAAPADKVKALREAGAEVAVLSEDENGRTDLGSLMEYLGRYPVQSLLVEGGSELAGSMMINKMIDKVMFFIAPMIIGGGTAPTPIGGTGFPHIDEAIELRDIEVSRIGSDILVQGYVVGNEVF
jgi:diaminohydroxyphosphoribosylaminopyrimidine deaminase/5-amino-6-(5-phosphoribosylamino)uracil reductase